jgi:hypothetical protein
LQFVALADAETLAPVISRLGEAPDGEGIGVTAVPAWGWHDADGAAVVYGSDAQSGLSSDALRTYLAGCGCTVQWLGKVNPGLPHLAAMAADAASGDDSTWFFKRWQGFGAPLLPAGNAEPDLPGAVAVAPRYTGLAARSLAASDLLEAIRAGRGWMTSDTNAALTLAAETGEGGMSWMGSRLSAATGAITLHITYSDQDGEPASLTLWQDGAPVAELLLPPADGRWDVAVRPAPGNFLTVVALQADGDFAITAPLFVSSTVGEPAAPAATPGPPGQPPSQPPSQPPGQPPGQPPSQPPGTPPDGGGPGGGPGGETGRLPEDDGGSGGANHAAAGSAATEGQAGGPPGSVAQAKLAGLGAEVQVWAIVTAPPGLFNGSMYVADRAGDGVTAGLGANVYLQQGVLPPLLEGDRVWLRGRWSSYRGEMELVLAGPDDIWKVGEEQPLHPLPVWAHTVCEAVEGRLVTFVGAVVGWQGDSLLLVDPAHPASAPVRITVRASLPWKRPYVQRGEIWQVTGIVSQFARARPWNGGYRVLPRYAGDLVRVE